MSLVLQNKEAPAREVLVRTLFSCQKRYQSIRLSVPIPILLIRQESEQSCASCLRNKTRILAHCLVLATFFNLSTIVVTNNQETKIKLFTSKNRPKYPFSAKTINSHRNAVIHTGLLFRVCSKGQGADRSLNNNKSKRDFRFVDYWLPCMTDKDLIKWKQT